MTIWKERRWTTTDNTAMKMVDGQLVITEIICDDCLYEMELAED